MSKIIKKTKELIEIYDKNATLTKLDKEQLIEEIKLRIKKGEMRPNKSSIDKWISDVVPELIQEKGR